MSKPRTKKRTTYRVEVTAITVTSGNGGFPDTTSEQKVLVQEKDTINLPAILTAVNGL